MKKNYSEIFEIARKICEEEDIEINIGFSTTKKTHSRKRARNNENNSSFDQTKESYDKIIDVYISELKTRFPKDELKSVIVIYNLLMLNDEKENSDSNYTDLLIYEKFINLDRLKHEISTFINYKIKFNNFVWKDLSNVIKNFVENNLKSVFNEIFKLIKIYLTIPISSAEAERSFSVLKLLKTWLTTTMEDERLSDLGVIKMACNLIIDYGLILNEFVKIKDRRLKLI